MANRSGDLGREGEKGVIHHMNRWHTQPELTGPRRARSKGSQDEGDLTGIPLTTIECKNYSTISPKMLMDNAREKAMRAQMPVWWLTVKKKGYGAQKGSGHWYAATDLLGLMEGLDIYLSDAEIDTLQSKAKADDTCIIKPIGDLSGKYGEKFAPPLHRWSVVLYGEGRSTQVMEAPYRMIDKWFKDTSKHNELVRRAGTDLLIPVAVSRERGASEEDLEGWYAVTTVHHMCRMLESLSILPQNPREYDPHDHAYWWHHADKLTRIADYDLIDEDVADKDVREVRPETMLILGSKCRTIPQHIIQRVKNWHTATNNSPVPTVAVLSVNTDNGATRFRCAAYPLDSIGTLVSGDTDALKQELDGSMPPWTDVDVLGDFEDAPNVVDIEAVAS